MYVKYFKPKIVLKISNHMFYVAVKVLKEMNIFNKIFVRDKNNMTLFENVLLCFENTENMLLEMLKQGDCDNFLLD